MSQELLERLCEEVYEMVRERIYCAGPGLYDPDTANDIANKAQTLIQHEVRKVSPQAL